MKILLLTAALTLTTAPAMAKDVCSYAYTQTKKIVELRMEGVPEVDVYKEAVKLDSLILKRITTKAYSVEPEELKTVAQEVFIGCLKAFGEDI